MRSAEQYLEGLRDGRLVHYRGARVRRAIDLHYAERASRDEIASQLEMTAEGVKTMLRRARHALRECVERKIER